ncbi:MAG: AraC family transcriptional regulator [Bacteroidales bacterium]
MIDYYLIAFSIPALICLFWFFDLILSTGTNRKSKRHLAFFMLCGFFTLLGELLFHNQAYSLYSSIYFFIVFFTIAQVPSLYLYLVSLTENKIHLKRYLKHYLFPFITAIIIAYFHYIWLSYEESIHVLQNFYSPEKLGSKQNITYIVELLSRNAFLLLAVFYLIIIHKKVSKHFRIVLNNYSNIQQKNLKWISITTVFFILMLLISSTACNPFLKETIYQPEYTISIPFLLLGIVFWIIGFLGNRQKMIIIPVDDSIKSVNLPEDFKKSLVAKLNQFMEEKKIYLVPDITLIELAKEVGTNRFYLSKIINEEFNMNFNSFINYHRIKHAIELMQDKKEEYTNFGEIATVVGYSNYMSFIRNFKKIHKVSPGEYLSNKNKKEA